MNIATTRKTISWTPNTAYTKTPILDTSKPHHTYTINVLHGTGASISMLPSDFNFAWTDIRDCLHTISGCLKGTKEKYNQIGEFHSLITLDTGETCRSD
jgi:hypothetical protein